jgi:hypothetical protein
VAQIRTELPAKLDFASTEVNKHFQAALDKTAARSMEILTGSSSGRRPARLPPMFSDNSIVDLSPYMTEATAPQPAQAPANNFFSSFFAPKAASAGASEPKARIPSNSAPKENAYSSGGSPTVGQSSRMSFESNHSSPRPESPSGVKRFFSRWARDKKDSMDSDDVVLAAKEIAVLDSAGLPVAPPAFRHFEHGGYAAGGLVDQDSPAKQAKAPTARDEIDDFFGSLSTGPKPVTSVKSMADPFDLLDPFSASSAAASVRPAPQVAPPVDLFAPAPSAPRTRTASPFDASALATKPSTRSSSPSGSAHVPFLPPSPSSSAPLKPVNLLADDDDFGDFAAFTASPAKPLPAPIVKPQGAKTPLVLKSKQGGGLSGADLDFFDSL